MKYLTSIELLRRAYKVLSVGKRDLPPIRQLKSLAVILQTVQKEVQTDPNLGDQITTLQSMIGALQEIQNLSRLPLKNQMIKALLQNDFATCKELSKNLERLDTAKFELLCQAKDRSRLIHLIDETKTMTEIPPAMQEILMKGVDTVITRFCDVAYRYYSGNQFEPTEPIIPAMREVVARYYGVHELVT